MKSIIKSSENDKNDSGISDFGSKLAIKEMLNRIRIIEYKIDIIMTALNIHTTEE